jgi:branched-chain amino acid transport system substrate-binding protein
MKRQHMKTQHMKTTSMFTALCVALLFITAACSSANTSSANSGATASNSSSATSSAAAPIVIGVIGSFTGPAASTLGPMEPAFNAWADSVNSAGGIRGHKVQLIVKDIGSGPATAGLTAAKELIGQDHVVAVISSDATQETWLPYAVQQSVPVIVAALGTTYGPDLFQTTASEVAAGYTIVEQAKSAGPSMGFGYCVEIPDCGGLAPLLEADAKDIGGVRVGFTASLSATQPDFTAFCLQLKNSGVKSYYIADTNAVIARVIDACAAQGVSAVPILSAGNGSASWLTDHAYQGALVNDFNPPFFDMAIPAMKAYRDAIDKYAPSISQAASGTSVPLWSWVGGQTVLTAVNRVNGPITAAAVKKALYTFKDETLGGLTVPLTFDESNPSISTCLYEWKVSDGKRVIVNGGKAQCAPETAIAPYLQKLG